MGTEANATTSPQPRTRLVLVVPCYNEARRLKIAAWHAHLNAEPDDRFVFVDDGSSDDTYEVLTGFQRTHPRVQVLRLEKNSGKAEAVRRGVLHALVTTECEYVGYWDADLSTSLELIHDFMTFLDQAPDALLAIGTRRRNGGSQVRRPTWRHLTSWTFSHVASAILGLRIRDTQCGAKVIRRNAAAQLFREPFLTPWLFDIEVLARVIHLVGQPNARSAIVEVQLREWHDYGESRFFNNYASHAPLDLLRIWWNY